LFTARSTCTTGGGWIMHGWPTGSTTAKSMIPSLMRSCPCLSIVVCTGLCRSERSPRRKRRAQCSISGTMVLGSDPTHMDRAEGGQKSSAFGWARPRPGARVDFFRVPQKFLTDQKSGNTREKRLCFRHR
jgi:hypothetical protein